jgi:hypothetical protein
MIRPSLEVAFRSGGRRRYGRCWKERNSTAELWEFAGATGVFAGVVFLLFRVVYLPGRTLERWEDGRPRPGRRDKHD